MAENGTLTTTEPEASEESLVFVGFFGSLICLGIGANLYIVVCILSARRLRTSQNAYVVNISLADLLLGVNGMFSFLEAIGLFGTLSQDVCRLLGVLSLVPAFVVVLSMVVIARSRYKAVTELGAAVDDSSTAASSTSTSHRRRRLGSSAAAAAALALGTVWTLSVLVAMPVALGWVTIGSGLFCACCFYFSENVEYGVTMTVIMYLLPSLLIGAYYARIVAHVRRSRRRVQRHQGASASRALQRLKRRNELRLATQFVVVFLVFNLCYAPSMVVFWLQTDEQPVPKAVDSLAMMLFSANVLALPVIFVAFNRTAREQIARTTLTVCRPSKENVNRRSTVAPPPPPRPQQDGRTSAGSVASVSSHSANRDVYSLGKLVVFTSDNKRHKTSVQSISVSDSCQYQPDNPLPVAT